MPGAPVCEVGGSVVVLKGVRGEERGPEAPPSIPRPGGHAHFPGVEQGVWGRRHSALRKGVPRTLAESVGVTWKQQGLTSGATTPGRCRARMDLRAQTYRQEESEPSWGPPALGGGEAGGFSPV